MFAHTKHWRIIKKLYNPYYNTKLSVTNHIEEDKLNTLVNIFGRTDVGKSRDHNEDNFAVGQDIAANQWEFNQHALKQGALGSVMVVADGMGGTNAGEVASEIMVNTAKQMFQQLQTLPESSQEIKDYLKKVIKTAHKNILNHATAHPDTVGMGTTAVIAWVIGMKAYVAWSGDSRVYHYRRGVALAPATNDHSMVWELVQSGHLTPSQARIHPQSNIITQSLGEARNPPKPEAKTIDLQAGDRLLLCSDGLNGELEDSEIETILATSQGTPEACQELVNKANLAGGSDNITVLLMDMLQIDNHTHIRDTSDQKATLDAQKKKIVLGTSVFILLCSLYLFFSNLGQPKNISPETIDKAGLQIQTMPYPLVEIDSANNKDSVLKEQSASTGRKDQVDAQRGTRPKEEKVDAQKVADLEVRLKKLLDEKANVLKSIERLKKSYKDVPTDLKKLNTLQQRLTKEIASPLLAKKIIKGSNEFIVPTTTKALERAIYTIERVEASLYDIQEKMKYWQLSPNG